MGCYSFPQTSLPRIPRLDGVLGGSGADFDGFPVAVVAADLGQDFGEVVAVGCDEGGSGDSGNSD